MYNQQDDDIWIDIPDV